MSHKSKKNELAENILAIDSRNGLKSISVNSQQSKLAWKQIGNLDKGIDNPTFETQCKLNDVLNVNIDELFKIHKKPRTIEPTEMNNPRAGRRLLK